MYRIVLFFIIIKITFVLLLFIFPVGYLQEKANNEKKKKTIK